MFEREKLAATWRAYATPHIPGQSHLLSEHGNMQQMQRCNWPIKDPEGGSFCS